MKLKVCLRGRYSENEASNTYIGIDAARIAQSDWNYIVTHPEAFELFHYIALYELSKDGRWTIVKRKNYWSVLA